MSDVKRTTIWDRLRSAYRAFRGKPIDRLTIGLELKYCKDCERGRCDACGYKMHSENIAALPDCNDCGRKRNCEWEPELGDYTRINCPHWEKEEKHEN